MCPQELCRKQAPQFSWKICQDSFEVTCHTNANPAGSWGTFLFSFDWDCQNWKHNDQYYFKLIEILIIVSEVIWQVYQIKSFWNCTGLLAWLYNRMKCAMASFFFFFFLEAKMCCCSYFCFAASKGCPIINLLINK